MVKGKLKHARPNSPITCLIPIFTIYEPSQAIIVCLAIHRCSVLSQTMNIYYWDVEECVTID